jgi:N-acetylglucosaminyldiphosphoundecaprenol N-acetyl-beta-D-mannosaminyltransferase
MKETLYIMPVSEARVLGYPISLYPTIEEALRPLLPEEEGVYTGVAHPYIVTLNPEMIMQGERSPAFGAILKNATLHLPDGSGVVWALKQQGIAQPRLPGIECAQAILEHLHRTQNPRGVAFLGAKPDVMGRLPGVLLQRYPDLCLAYARDGYVPPEEMGAVVQEMVAAHPRVVMVALGVPRQEEWISQYRSHFAPDTLFIGVGGSFDVWAGQVQRAPRWMQRLNLEWAWRFYLEPWRMKRSTWPILQFMWRVWRRSFV